MDYWPVAVSLLAVFIPSAICQTGSNAGNNVKFRPNPSVFGVAWPLLLVAIGCAWYMSRSGGNSTYVDLSFGALIATLALWIFLYSCRGSKKEASWVIALALLFNVICYTIAPSIGAKVLTSPLIVWLIFALIMNTTEVQAE